MQTLNWGIELEVVNLSKANAAHAIQSVVGGTVTEGPNGSYRVLASDGRLWNVVHDGSLSGPSSQNAEVVSPILHFEDIERLQEVVRALRKAGAKTSPSAGMDFGMPPTNEFPIRDAPDISAVENRAVTISWSWAWTF